MSVNTKYYYLKLKDNFYDRTEIKAIEGMESGYEYICLIQKMYLRSLQRNGKLMLTDLIPYDIKTLSSVLGHKQETVKTAVDLFRKFGLIEILDNDTIYMTDIQNYIGNSSSEADRIRNYRNEISNKSSTKSVQMYDISTPEIRDKRLERVNSLTRSPALTSVSDAVQPALFDDLQKGGIQLTAGQKRKLNADEIFDFYCEVFGSLGKRPIKSADKLSKIEARLKRFSLSECKLVIESCRRDTFLCGSNPQSKFYAFVDYIFRSDDHFEKLLDTANNQVNEIPKCAGIIFTDEELSSMSQDEFVATIKKYFDKYDIGTAMTEIKSAGKEITRSLIWQWHTEKARFPK